MVKIPNHKIWRELWLTKGLSKSIYKCGQLYKTVIKNNSTQESIEKYKTYRNCLTQIKCKARATYYVQHCYALKSSIKKLWQLINNVIKHTHDKMSIIDHKTVNNIKYHEAKDVANQFGKFYSKIGAQLANTIKTTDHDYKYYLKKITPNPNMMYIHNITSSKIIKYINKLPSKNSSGYDNISNILL